jgi:hypothetical protein
VITLVLFIASFEWYLWLIMHIAVQVVSFSSVACNGIQ